MSVDFASVKVFIKESYHYCYYYYYYNVFRKKHPLVFSFITSSQINQFAQKFQHL